MSGLYALFILKLTTASYTLFIADVELNKVNNFFCGNPFIVINKLSIDGFNAFNNSIDLDDFPSVQGEPMVVVANRRPSAAGTNHGDDVPNRIGQIWVDTTNKKAYIAVALGSTGDDSWKQITI